MPGSDDPSLDAYNALVMKEQMPHLLELLRKQQTTQPPAEPSPTQREPELLTHKWVGRQVGGNPANAESYEYVRYCDVCGMEDYGEDEPIPPCPGTEEIDFGVEPYGPENAIMAACGLLDVIKSEWGEAWSEHDQKTRAGLSRILSRNLLSPATQREPDAGLDDKVETEGGR